MSTCTVSATPFEKIALSFSGGGYRAATFHLGAMHYLNTLKYEDKPLIDRVEMISTVSGGTITGVVYALMKAENKSFDEVFDFMMGKLRSIDLISESLAKLDPGKLLDTTSKRKNLINAFAELYDKHFTEGKTLKDLTSPNAIKATIFNSTDFNNAVDFRFMNIEAGYTGNNYIKNYEDVSNEIRLSDIMAASSCFPGGFEPIIWPQDFNYDGAKNLNALSENTSPVGLMDGGIYDNQGIDAILNFKNGHKEPYYDLIIISDVASPYMKHYSPTPEIKKKGWYTWTVNEIIDRVKSASSLINRWLVGVTLFFLLLPLLWKYSNTIITGVLVGVGITLLILLIAKFFIERKVIKVTDGLVEKAKSIVPKEIYTGLSKFNFRKLSLHRIEPLLLDRLNSLLILMMDAFLKIVRRLNYDVLYENKSYEQRRVSNLVQELTKDDFNNKIDNKRKHASPERIKQSLLLGNYEEVITPSMRVIIDEAAAFGTTLWFTEQQHLDNLLNKLIVTGKITMCYNMLEYLENIIFDSRSGYNELDNLKKQQLQTTYELCKKHWLALKEKPESNLTF